MYKSNHEFLKENTKGLSGLLENPEFGIISWHEQVQSRLKKFADFYDGKIDYSKRND